MSKTQVRNGTAVMSSACLFVMLSACDSDNPEVVREPAPNPASLVTPDLLRTFGGAEDSLFAIQDAAMGSSGLAVLTGSEPAVHLFSGGRLRNEWGSEGGGPAELSNPRDVLWKESRLLVLDFNPSGSKIASYDDAGNFLAARSTAPVAARSLAVSGGDTLVETWEFASDAAAIVRIRGQAFDTIVSYQKDRQIRLTAPGSPSLTVNAPFSAQPVWDALPKGGVAFWNGETDRILRLTVEGDTAGGFPLPQARYAVTGEDRDIWFRDEIPSDFMGRGDVFAPLRKKARQELAFPTEFPAALALLADPSGGVWIQRTPRSHGQIWTWVGSNGTYTSMQLPPRRELIAVGASELVALTKDELDVEVLEVYRKPDTSQTN